MKLFGSSGIRRVVDREFLHLVFDVGLAVGTSYGSVVTGCDTRTSSSAVRYAFLSGLLSSGATVSSAGMIPTPTLAYAARNFEVGAMITASHNPPQYNGIKLINADGSAFDAAQREQLEKIVSSKSAEVVQWHEIKESSEYSGSGEEHIERILADFTGQLKIKVVLDCGCGAASVVTPVLLSRLGCVVIPLNCQPSGYFPRASEPSPENLSALQSMVKAEGADLGIAHDGDGDRIAVIDDEGNFVPQDKLLALFARQVKAKKVVTTVDASMLIEELGIDVVRTRVGDAFVSDELRGYTGEDMIESFGGESSGCFIFPWISLCPDAIYAAAMIVKLAGERRVSELIDQMPSYPLLRGGIAGDNSIMQDVKKSLMSRVDAGCNLETIDGLRLEFDDGWLLIRPSGTEPKIRITAEAISEQRAGEIYNLGVEVITDCLNVRERATT